MIKSLLTALRSSIKIIFGLPDALVILGAWGFVLRAPEYIRGTISGELDHVQGYAQDCRGDADH
jgi:hypothetical protein